MKSAPIVQRIIKEVQNRERICVVGHIRPDGDCIGSQVGLSLALQNAGKKVTCWNADPVPRKLAFLDPQKLVQPPRKGKSFDCVIATDAASFERLGQVGAFILKRGLLINIDHHASNTHYADLNWVRGEMPSTGELIFHLMKKAQWTITPAIADCLFTAISTDTGSFQYPSTQPETYTVAGELVKRGANLGKICQEVYQSNSLARVRLLQHIYNQFRLACRNQIAYFWLRPSDFARTGASPDDTEGLIDHIRSIDSVVVACVLEELEPELARVSLRSKSNRVNVGEIAALFGGGGHAAAAGARIAGTRDSVQRQLINAIKRALNRAP